MKIKTYGIHGVVERVLAARLGKITFNISFNGGVMDSAGIRPAIYTTKNVVEQYVIENHPMFKNGSIKVLKEIAIEEKKEQTATPKPAEKKAAAKLEEVKVASLEDAKELLMERFGIAWTKLKTQDAIMAMAKANGIMFIIGE